MKRHALRFALAWVMMTAVASVLPGFAQVHRILGPIDDSQTVALKGNMSARAETQYDRGPVEPGYQLDYMTLGLRPSAKQQSDLKQLLADQQNPSSPHYHKWITPQEYAKRFGLSQSDINAVVSWLEGHGFAIERVANGRNWVAFSGTAAQVAAAFHTSVHRYEVNGEEHVANATPPSVPKGLAGIVGSIGGLNDFRPHGGTSVKKIIPSTYLLPVPRPDFTSGSGSHFLAPDDIATIYDFLPLLNATPTPFDGSGQKVVVVGQSEVHLTDINAFRSLFGLSTNPPTVVVVGTDPGFNGAEDEGDLDLEWVGAVARKASITYVVSNSAFNAAVDAIDNNRAPVISVSYSLCEAQLGSSNATFFQQEIQKGNTFGITLLASSGDAGAAACDDQNTELVATAGLAVNIPASIPETTAVGGTEFNEGGNTSYWGPNGPNKGSAQSYIPEMAWNDGAEGTKTSGGLWSSGGGISAFFSKPTWQTALTPADNFRDVPDMSMTASGDHDGYMVCFNNICPAQFGVFGGTSASTPVTSGLIVLLNQYLVAKGFQTTPGVGNFNNRLYQLAQSVPAAFHDITTSSNIVPCASGSPNCTAPADTLGYSAGPGYDRVTGLGSVDAHILVTSFSARGTTTTLMSSAAQIPIGGNVTFTATVAPASGTGTPTGSVTFLDGTTTLGTGTLSAGVATFMTSTLTPGLRSITAVYTGDATFASSTSVAFMETVGTLSQTTLMTSAPQVNAGQNVTFTATVAPTSGGSGTPTGNVTFMDGSTVLGPVALSSGTAIFSTSSLAVGVHSITGVYAGDSTFAGSTSATLTQTIGTNSQTTLQTSAAQVQLGGSVTFTALVAPQSGTGTPTGMVTFMDGTSPIGSSSLTAGTAVLSTSMLSTGSHSISAVYPGDTTFLGSTSSALSQLVVNITVAATPTMLSIPAGGSGTVSLAVTPSAGYMPTVTVTCTGAPSEATCTVGTPTTSGGVQTFPINITSTAPHSLRQITPMGMFLPFGLLLPLGGMFLAATGKRTRRHLGWLGLMLVLTMSTLWLSACGGSGKTDPGTPPGSYPLTVTATTGGTVTITSATMVTLGVTAH